METKILVVDDQQKQLKIISKILSGQGYQTRTACSGRLALEMIHHDIPDLILLDIKMPDMDGFEVCRELKADDETREIPIIFISGLEDVSNKVKAFRIGGADYIIKPPGKKELLARVGIQLENRRYRKYLAEEVRKRTIDLEARTLELEYLNNQLNMEINERKRVEKALQESEQRYRSVVEDIPAMICRFLPDGTITFADNTFCHQVDHKWDDQKRRGLTGQDFFQLIPEEEKKEIKSFLSSLTPEDPNITYDYKTVHSDKTVIWHEWTVRALFNEQKNLIEYQSIGRDITEVKHAREERAKLESQLRHSRKLEAIGTLAGGIAHDFNNILTPIILRTEMALSDISDEKSVKRNLGQVLIAGCRAKELIQQILVFSRQNEQEKKHLKLGPIIKEVLKLLRASIPSTIEIQIDIQADNDMTLADPIDIHQVLMNLCTNAAYAMAHKGGILSISLTEESIEEDQYPELKQGAYLKLIVKDTGCGIDAAIIEKIFDPFFTTKALSEGTGMGLPVVYGIIKSYGGMVTVESGPGKGSVFNLFFPKTEKEPEPAIKTHHDLPGGNESILLVDDEEEIVNALREFFLGLGYKVESYSNSVNALKQFKSKPDKFDLVITDQTMPGMTGEMLAKKIMNIRADIPIILCTGFSHTVTEDRAKQLGIKEFVMKPIIMNKMAATIRSALDNIDDKGTHSHY